MSSILYIVIPCYNEEEVVEKSASVMGDKIKRLQQEYEARVKKNAADVKADGSYQASFNKRMEELKAQYAKETAGVVSSEAKKRNEILAKEIYLVNY